MKIFQVITLSEYGGAQSIVAELIRNMDKSHEVFILYGGDGEAWRNLEGNFTRIRLGKSRKKVSLFDIILFLKLLYYRLKYRPDVIHLHSSKMGALGRLAFNPKKIVYTVHGFDSIRKAYRKFLIIEQKLKDRAYRIVGVSRYDVECLREEGIFENVVQVYNGVTDNTHLQYDIRDAISLELERIKQEYTDVVMCISRISKQKKFDMFLNIAQQMPNVAFVWIGNKEAISNLPRNVYCMGESSMASIYLRYASIFVLTSNYEGIPVSVLEALSFGKPIVASNVGGMGEILNNENGFALENKVDLFVDKIGYILSDQNVYKEMSEQARLSYETNFSIDGMISGYLSIFNEIAENSKK